MMKRLLTILFILTVSLLALDNSASAGKNGMDNNANRVISSLDIPLNNQIDKYSSKEFTIPSTSSRTITNSSIILSLPASYTLRRRVNIISSHSTHPILKSGSHRYLSYGILRV
jgi:hypothetical protein